MDSCVPRDSLNRQYIVLHTIGHGAFGTVKLAIHRVTGIVVAIKILRNREEDHKRIFYEINMMKEMDYPHIVHLLQVIRTPENFYLIMDYVGGGTLMHLIQQTGGLEEATAQRLFGQILAAVAYCHSKNIVHRDLKPHNILVDPQGYVKILDFGLAKRYVPGKKLYRCCGTLYFNAPEMYLGEGYEAEKGEVWALGALLYTMIVGDIPFKAPTRTQTIKKILSGSYKLPNHLSGALENLIHQLFRMDPEQRPTIKELTNHPWIQQCNHCMDFRSEMDPNPEVLTIMFYMGYDVYDIIQSIQDKNYDTKMGTYMILEQQVRENIDHEEVHPGYTPFPSEAGSSTLDLSQKSSSDRPQKSSSDRPQRSSSDRPQRSTSDPGLPTPAIGVSNNSTANGQKIGRSTSLPSLPVCCPQDRPACSSHTVQCETPATSPRPSSKSKDSHLLKSHPEVEAAPPPQGNKWRKRLRRLGQSLLKYCCCCLPIGNTGPRSNKVVPMKQAESRTP